MLEFKLGKLKISLSITFFALVAALTAAAAGSTDKIITALLCCVIHELGHMTMMFRLGVPPAGVTLYAGGIKLIPQREKRLLSDSQDFIILFAGCAVNFLTAFAIRTVTGEWGFFAAANIFLGIFNLLPLRYFDGGRILTLIAGERTAAFVRTLFSALLLAALAYMLVIHKVSFSLAATFIYVLLAEISFKPASYYSPI